MSEKAQPLKETVDHHHGKWSEGGGTQHSSSGNRKQRRYSKDKQQRYPAPSASRPKPHLQSNGGHRSYHRPSSQQRWSSGQRERRRDGVKDSDKLCVEVSASYSPDSRPTGSGEERRKKSTPVSLNHLLNFTFVPTERRNSGVGGALSIPGKRRRARNGHSYNKEQFLQANCQFVVSSSGDYSIHSADPDKLVDWDNIEQVRLLCHQIPSCPICLYPPRAAKITRCGHVYCWSCMLHYLALSERRWGKCPICYESIYRTDLKSVTALSNPQYRVGDTITMTLMVREKSTTHPIPKSKWTNKTQHLQTLIDSSTSQYEKLLSASPQHVLELITAKERSELECQLSSIGPDEASEQAFIEAALNDLKAREERLREIKVAESEVSQLVEDPAPEREVVPPSLPASTSDEQPWTALADCYYDGEYGPAFSDHEDEATIEDDHSRDDDGEGCGDSLVEQEVGETPLLELESIMTSSDNSPEVGTPKSNSCDSSPGGSPESATSRRGTTSEKYTYFYQASDGQHLYLHPVNARCLIHEYQALENCPEEVSATIVEMEQLSMAEDVRSKYRYLSHLPLTCEFVLCELDLRPPLLSRDTMREFSDEIHRRRQKRTKKRKEEKRREKKAEAKTSKPEPTFRVPTSAHEMTPEKFHDFLSLASSPPLPSTSPPHTLTPSHPHSLTPSRPHTQRDGERKVNGFALPEREGKEETSSTSDSAPSFAQALRGKPPPLWPIKSPPKPPAGSNATTKVSAAKTASEVEGEESEQLVPAFQDAFNDALLSASVSVLAAQNASEGKPGGKTTKKGRKKLVLFSTGGSRGVN